MINQKILIYYNYCLCKFRKPLDMQYDNDFLLKQAFILD